MKELQAFNEQVARLSGKSNEVQNTFLHHFIGGIEYRLGQKVCVRKRDIVSCAENAADYALKGGSL